MATVLLNDFFLSKEIFYLNQYSPAHHAPIPRGNKAGLLDLDHSQINNLAGVTLKENIFRILVNNILGADEIWVCSYVSEISKLIWFP